MGLGIFREITEKCRFPFDFSDFLIFCEFLKGTPHEKAWKFRKIIFEQGSEKFSTRGGRIRIRERAEEPPGRDASHRNSQTYVGL